MKRFIASTLFRQVKGNGSYCAMWGKIPLVCTSRTETEYACCYAAQEVMFLHMLIHKLGFSIGKPSILIEDNLSTFEIIKGNINHKTGQHINPKQKVYIFKSYSLLFTVPTRMITELLTNALYQAQHNQLPDEILDLSSHSYFTYYFTLFPAVSTSQ